jgi:hypothetical protein
MDGKKEAPLVHQALRSSVRWLLLAGAVSLALLPLVRSCADYVDQRTYIAAERWQEAKAGWRAGWIEAGARSMHVLIAVVALDLMARIAPAIDTLWRQWRSRPRWIRAGLRLKRRRKPGSRSSALDL